MASMMNELQKDFDALMEKFQRESDKKGQINLFDLFKESLYLFEKLKDVLKNCSEEEKKQVFSMMAEMHQFMMRETRKIAEKTGMTEDQLMRFSENPDNFTSSQWKSLEVIKEKLENTAQDLKGLLRKDAPKEPKEHKPHAKTHKSAKKDRWMRS
jgi:hypothetical protein